ncbi:hypothetical protein KHP60_21155 [Microvirga sp. 3-52]|uniref:hypothetical protein n=1 Tax=Microvirga sp. 3-52 TaxID=2792425 RepID=UPI001AC1E354|nr:hypothetical protein [Microvirga sp. 3-52]MBO1907022.1 hypothetical protein [Microvirga sp. 3-52]MBS7454818.1 hypothetical protein [Microvirga sp. 3-52]
MSIGGIVRHGRTRRDAQNLEAHLLKDASEADVEIVNSIAPTLNELLQDMQVARDGAGADAAFLHFHISPSISMTIDQMRRAGEIVRQHFGAVDHPCAMVPHRKDRIGGDGDLHGHFAIQRAYGGKVIPSGFEIIKMETAMRLVEYEFGEKPTLGRHHASSLKWLRANGREDVADWLEAAHGADPERPRSAASPAKRQGLKRKGVELPEAKELIARAWTVSDDAKAFRNALREQGFDVTPGKKDGVFVVTQDGIEIGSVDRLVKEKRAAVAARMKGLDDVAAAEFLTGQVHQAGPEGYRGRVENLSGSEGCPPSVEAGVGTPGPVGGGRGNARSVAGREGSPDADRDCVGRAGAAAPEPRESSRRDPRRERAAWQARRLAAVAGLARMDIAGLRAQLTEAMRPAVDKVTEQLDAREREAKKTFAFSKSPVVEPETLRDARENLAKAQAASTKLFYAKGKDRDEAARQLLLLGEKPTGFKSWITGRTARWKRDAAPHRAVIEDYDGRKAKIEQHIETYGNKIKTHEVSFRPQLNDQLRKREDAATKAKEEFKLLDEARTVLKEHPELAAEGVEGVLAETRRRLDRKSGIDGAPGANGQRVGFLPDAARRRTVEDEPAAPRFR